MSRASLLRSGLALMDGIVSDEILAKPCLLAPLGPDVILVPYLISSAEVDTSTTSVSKLPRTVKKVQL